MSVPTICSDWRTKRELKDINASVQKMKFRERIKKDLDFRTAIVRLIVAAVAFFVIAALALLQFFYPFRTLLPAYALPERKEGEMRFHFLDVGQGDCSIVEFPDGAVVMVDSGLSEWRIENRVTRYLKSLRPTAFSLVVTHADIDHYGNALAVLDDFKVDALYLPAVASETEDYARIISLAEGKGVPMSAFTRYTVLSSGGAYGVCLAPYAEGETDENEASAVVYFEYAGVGAVLCGDVGAAREELLAREYALFNGIFDSGDASVRLERTEILKVAHHGSGGASSREWLELLSPSVSIISCGKGNRYGHPASDALTRIAACGSEIYRTDELGDIMVTISKDGTFKAEYGYLK